MKTPEELLREWGLTDSPVELDWGIHSWRCSMPDRYGACTCFQELVQELAARDAEVRADERAKVLAGFTEVHTLAWDGEPSMSGAPHRCSTAAEVDLETARRALSTVGRRKPNPRIERRLVSPWQPVADEGGAS